MKNNFNLITEPWIPVARQGRVSLSQLFSNPELTQLGGTPINKISVLKLLLAIAHAANTPSSEAEWRDLGPDGLARACTNYLDRHQDRFNLFSNTTPFLQMPAIAKARIQSFGAVLPEVATGNTTVLTQWQQQRTLPDADKALLLVALMSCALAGKKTDNSVVLTANYKGKTNATGRPGTGRSGPAIGYLGFLHSFVLGKTLHETLWLNLLSAEQIAQTGMFPAGPGRAPWEQMPAGEACPVAQALQKSLMGRLVPLSRFCLLTEAGLHYSEGIAHSDYREGLIDPSIAVNFAASDPKALWADPARRPWRELTALLSFLDDSHGPDDPNDPADSANNSNPGFPCWQLRFGLSRARAETNQFAIFSGGIRVSNNAGEQFVSGSDDFVESELWLESRYIDRTWFTQLKAEMDALNNLSRLLFGKVTGYYTSLSAVSTGIPEQTMHTFWQSAERRFSALVAACADTSQLASLRKSIADAIFDAYDRHCPHETARQISAWAQHRPNLSSYLNPEET